MQKKSQKLIKEPEQDTVGKLLFAYKKRCQSNGIQIENTIKQKLQIAINEVKLQVIQISLPLGVMQARALIQALIDCKHKKLKILRIWKSFIQDEGLRVISKYMDLNPNLEILDLLDNQITKLGCQFLGQKLLSQDIKLKQLKLDNNNIGTEGLGFLAIGLRQIKTLDKLSLKYCNIDSNGSKYLQQILANINSKLRSLKVQGNPLQNVGIYQLLRAVKSCGENLQKINIADTKLNLLDYKKENEQSIQFKIAEQLKTIMKFNDSIIKYEIRFNQMQNILAQQILQLVKCNNMIKQIQFPNSVKYEIRDQLDNVIRPRNKKKKIPKKKKK